MKSEMVLEKKTPVANAPLPNSTRGHRDPREDGIPAPVAAETK